MNHPMDPTTQAMYSLDAEEYGHNTPKDVFEALERQQAFHVGIRYYMAACVRVRPGPFDAAELVLEQIQTQVYTQAGDAADVDIESVEPAARQELNDVINKWAMEHLNIVHYWKPVSEAIELTVTADDVEIYRGQTGLPMTETESIFGEGTFFTTSLSDTGAGDSAGDSSGNSASNTPGASDGTSTSASGGAFNSQH